MRVIKIGQMRDLIKEISGLHIGLYAANACYFLVLSALPGLLLLPQLLHWLPLDGVQLGSYLGILLPEPLMEEARQLLHSSNGAASAPVLGLSALTALWSAGRGIYGLLTGLNAVYGVEERRSWLHRRLLCMGYTFAFFLLMGVTLALLVFGSGLLELLRRVNAPIVRFAVEVLDWRFVLLVLLQTGVFCGVYLTLPNCPGGFRQALPGALLSCCGWLLFSEGYSLYVERLAPVSGIYGPVYAVALAMLWLYGCMAIVLLGGALNARLMGEK